MKCWTLVSKCLAAVIALTLLILSSWVVWDNWGRFVFTPVAVVLHNDQNSNSKNLGRGEYLTLIGGCVACHTAKGGEPLAGGRRIETPFGAVFSSNLTPSLTHGLGRWTETEFQNALHWGRSRDGHLLLPVFPYNHTSVFTAEDVRAIFSWLQNIKPIDQAPPAHRLTWPLGTQPIIAVWRSLFFTPNHFKADESQSEAWNRGAYLVQSAGHCAACHGQRNSLGSFPAIDDVSGGFISPQMWVAPSLRNDTQTTMANSSIAEIANLLRIGQSQTSTVSGPMAEFVQHTGQYLSASDALAIATYLKSRVNPTTPSHLPPAALLAFTSPNAQTIYKTQCASCHGANGEGKPNAYPALAGNPAVVLAQPENLIQMVLYGGYGPSTEGRPRPYGMPPYLFTLNNQQIADVLNHIRSQWGNKAGAINPMQVDRIRAATY